MTDEWAREVRFSPPYDHRDTDWNKGAHGMDIYFILSKVDGSGAITASIGTDWMRHPLKNRHFTPGEIKRERWDKPGIDATRVRSDGYQERYPNPQVVALHMPTQDKDWWYGADSCDVLKGGTCYGDHGYMVCDQFVVALIEGGHEGAWKWLEETFNEWTGPDDDD